jgi:hypothetical protein
MDTPNAYVPTAPDPQTGALTAAGVSTPEEDAESLAAPQPDMGQTIAQHQIEAGKINNGNPRDWAENAVAGVQAALAGFGAAGKVPEGAGALYGVGKAAAAAQENRQAQAKEKAEQGQRQQQLDMQKQRLSDEEGSTKFDQQMKLAENARQQAGDVRDQALHDKRMQQLTDDHNANNFKMMKDEIDFRQDQVNKEDTLKAIGAKPMVIAGQETPAFDDLGQLERYATDNKLGEQAHANGYRSRPVMGADGKYHIYEVPDSGPEWHSVKDPDGKEQKIFGDPLSVLNYQEKVAQVHASNAETSLRYADAQKARDEYKTAGTVKAARKELSSVGGDYSKLSDGAKEALRGDAQKQYDLSWNVYQAARKDMQRDSDFSSVPVDAKGNVDTNSQEFKDLAAKYHVDEANEQLGSAYDDLRQLGHGYKAPGSTPAPAAKTPGAPEVGAVQTHNGASYKFDGKQWVKQAAPAAEQNPAQVGAAGYGEGAAKTIR